MKNMQISERIAKVIARGSKYSRRDAEKLILISESPEVLDDSSA